MQGGYNVAPLIECLTDADEEIAACAADQLKMTLLVFDAFYDVEQLVKDGNKVRTVKKLLAMVRLLS